MAKRGPNFWLKTRQRVGALAIVRILADAWTNGIFDFLAISRLDRRSPPQTTMSFPALRSEIASTSLISWPSRTLPCDSRVALKILGTTEITGRVIGFFLAISILLLTYQKAKETSTPLNDLI
jgi:hypothetical protein